VVNLKYERILKSHKYGKIGAIVVHMTNGPMVVFPEFDERKVRKQ
jgi:hypothetical protein